MDFESPFPPAAVDAPDPLRILNAETIDSWRYFLDLDVRMSVELGRTKLTVKEILDLEPHYILQLPRSTGEGVDIYAGPNRLARGQILMIEDRMGVRINDVIKQADE